MRGPTLEDLEAWLSVTMERDYAQFLQLRFFAARIVSVTRIRDAAFMCRLTQLGDSTSDGHDYLCCTPGYTPQIGDQVECVWKDRNVGYVLWPINGFLPPRSRVHSAGNQVIGLNWTAVSFETLDWGSYGGGWIGGVGAFYTVRLPGYYRAHWAVATQVQNNPQRYVASLWAKPLGGTYAEVARGSDLLLRGGVAGDSLGSVGSETLPLNAGDQLQVQAFNGGGANITLFGNPTPPAPLTYCTIYYEGPK